ncbi:MAG: hypothetical protein ACJA0H_002420 [Francisellaceae bacterium]
MSTQVKRENLNIFIISLLVFFCLLLSNYIYKRKINELFGALYFILCYYLSIVTSTAESPFIKFEGILAAIMFCILSLFKELFVRHKQSKKETYIKIEIELKYFLFISSVTFSLAFVLFGINLGRIAVLLLFLSIASFGSYVLSIAINRGYNYFCLNNKS